MPDNTTYVAAAVAVSAAVTWALRTLPFAALAPLRASDTLRYLSVHMPVGVMVILTVYTLRGVSLTNALPVGLALVVTLGLHLWRRNAVLSVLGGTAIHVALASTVFSHS
ncbi:branched-chain amino acid transporter permease [Streptomyces cinnamoneus]|uniref:Branched-chain amino acid transport protein n=1 Tax=Streptomyces cinnamoneus TaxID=53446 RepID=A0A918TBJ5_STRCJ|nr:AzlD domain-containing protein [Streptomyces cinnamoneus]GHC38969.1 putative branched-chain amino acid transport protein [Streptomyces cinnamoneus]